MLFSDTFLSGLMYMTRDLHRKCNDRLRTIFIFINNIDAKARMIGKHGTVLLHTVISWDSKLVSGMRPHSSQKLRL